MATALVQFNSVEGLLGHLDDEDDEVIHSSLQSLVELMPLHWSEIADEITTIEKLSEDDAFPFSSLASLLASQIFFHIQSYSDSLNHALCAGDLFDVSEDSEYVLKLTEQCIDSYRTFQQSEYNKRVQRQSQHKKEESDDDDDDDDDGDGDDGDEEEAASPAPSEAMDPRKIQIVEKVFDFCLRSGALKHAIGIAIECRRLDRVEDAIRMSGPLRSELLRHCFVLCETVISSRTFRDEMLRLMVSLLAAEKEQFYSVLCRCYFYLDDTRPISRILGDLITDCRPEAVLTAFQIAFDLAEFQNDAFLRAIFKQMPRPPRSQLADEAEAATVPAPDAEDGPAIDIAPTAMDCADDGDVAGHWDSERLTKWKRLKSILLGETQTPKHLDFLYRNNHSDMVLLCRIKEGISERNSVLNNSLICANGLMHCGTTIDQFLRDNLEWMARAAHWSKFTATASVGMIHHHHLAESRGILQRYLPGSGGGPYQEGGALYALGLIHCGDASNEILAIRQYLAEQLKAASNEILQHGACLALGLAALGYGTQSGSLSLDRDSDDDAEAAEAAHSAPPHEAEVDGAGGPSASALLSAIREVLFQDRAVPGEAAGLSLGLLLVGSGNKQWYEEMAAYSHETQHEKIQRGLVMGIAFVFYNLQEQAQYAIDALIADKSDTVRYGGCYTVGMAYAATASTSAIALLLHLAVSDVSNDVRRAAVTNLGFVLCSKPAQLPKVVQLLAASYNEHVRYGAAAALGIACAGTGNAAALSILRQLARDKVDYVRQSALIALAMVLVQHHEAETPLAKEVRALLLATCTDKREPTMSQMGAILGCGIIDAAGRNATISLFNAHNNCRRQSAIVGMAMFWQYWYWYPLIPFITLSFRPTMLMALNGELQMVKLSVESRERNRARFDYVENLKEETKDRRKKAISVELSVAAKTKQRRQQRQKEMAREAEGDRKAQDAESADSGTAAEHEEAAAAVGAAEGAQGADASDDAKAEGDGAAAEQSKFNVLENPCRVTPNRVRFIKWVDTRYKPMTSRFEGFVMVQDTRPELETQLVEQKEIAKGGVYGDEPDPPKPFLFLRE